MGAARRFLNIDEFRARAPFELALGYVAVRLFQFASRTVEDVPPGVVGAPTVRCLVASSANLPWRLALGRHMLSRFPRPAGVGCFSQ